MLLQHDRAPRDAASSERLLARLDLLAVGTLALAGLRMTVRTEQRLRIKFCQKLDENCTETYDMVKVAFGEDSMGHSQVFEWFRRIKEGQTFVESDTRPGRLLNEQEERSD